MEYRINQKTRKKLNNRIIPLTRMNHKEIHLDVVSNILSEYGLLLLQEDFTEWSGFLCGREGNVSFMVGKHETDENGRYIQMKHFFVLSWYKRESGLYEINCYIS